MRISPTVARAWKWLFAVVLAATGFNGIVQADTPTYVDTADAAAEGRSVDPDSVEVSQQFELPPGVIRWTAVRYISSGEECTDVVGELLLEVDLGADQDTASIGGCGEPEGPFPVSVGGVELGGVWYNVIHGDVSDIVKADEVLIFLNTGATIDIEPSDGFFVAIVPGPNVDVVRISAVSGDGEESASVEPPALP